MHEQRVMDLDTWKGLAEKHEAPVDVLLRKAFIADEIITAKSFDEGADPADLAKAAGLGERDVAIVISTSSKDRDGDTIDAEGWKTAPYRKNPVVLWAHDYRSLPIARATKIQTGGGKLSVVDHFVEPEVDGGMGDIVLQMLKRKYLNAASVGFKPLKYLRNAETGGMDFAEQELLEHSIVPVPANAEALVELRTVKGLDLRPLALWAEKFLDEHGGDEIIVVRPGQVERLLKVLKPTFSIGTTDSPATPATAAAAVDDHADKGAIPYKRTPLAPEGEAWDAGKEVGAASVDDLRVMCTWYGGDGANKGDYKLPHHKSAGGHATVWRGVAAAAARLGGTRLPASDMAAVKAHLGKHYGDFGKEAPWKAASVAWAKVEAAAELIAKMADDKREPLLADLLDGAGFPDEAAALRSECSVSAAAAAGEHAATPAATSDAGVVEAFLADMRAANADASDGSTDDLRVALDGLTQDDAFRRDIQAAAREALNTRLGRLD